MEQQWKMLAKPIFSMNSWNFLEYWLVPADSTDDNKFILAWPSYSMNSWNFIDSKLVPGDSLENHKFMEYIGQAKIFNCFSQEFMEYIGLANIFHGFMSFHGFRQYPVRFFGRP